jgi:Xaa-Pro aminopeptidase
MAVVQPAAADGELLRAERDFRWQRAGQFLRERNLDGLLVLGGAERPAAELYLTNNGLGQHVIFPLEGEVTVLCRDTNYIGEHFISAERGEGSFIHDIRIGLHPPSIAAVIREKGLHDKRIGAVGIGPAGLLMPNGWANYRHWNGVLQQLPQATFEDVTWDFLLMMMRRSPYETELLRKSAAAGEAACEAMLEAARPGATEQDVYTAGMSAFHRFGVRCRWMIIQSGPDNVGWGEAMWLIRAQEPRRLQNGDVVSTELFPNNGMLEAQQQLAIGIGDLHPDFDRCATVARQCYDAGLAALKPGITFGQLCEAMEEPVREAGAWHLTPQVHSLNPLMMVSSYGIDIEKHVPALKEKYGNIHGREVFGAEVEVQPGMAFAFEPNCCLGRHRVNIGGTVVVTDTGCEELNSLPCRFHRL